MTQREEVSKKIWYLMEQRGWNIRDLSIKLGKTHQNTAALINSISTRKNFAMKSLEVFAEIFNVSVIELLTPLPEDINPLPTDGRRNRSKKKI